MYKTYICVYIYNENIPQDTHESLAYSFLPSSPFTNLLGPPASPTHPGKVLGTAPSVGRTLEGSQQGRQRPPRQLV